MKHGKGIIITTVIIVVICFVAVPLGVNYAFRQEAPVDIFAARSLLSASTANLYSGIN